MSRNCTAFAKDWRQKVSSEILDTATHTVSERVVTTHLTIYLGHKITIEVLMTVITSNRLHERVVTKKVTQPLIRQVYCTVLNKSCICVVPRLTISLVLITTFTKTGDIMRLAGTRAILELKMMLFGDTSSVWFTY